MSKKTDTYFIKKQKKPREIASVIFPKPKKTIIEPIKLSVLPADRLDDYTLTPYDIDPVDGLPTVEYLQENPDLISMVQGPARGMLQTKLRKGKELKIQSQKALIDLPNILEDNKQDRQRGIVALLNVMDSLPARIRADLLQNINQAQGGPAPISPPPASPPPIGPASPPPIGPASPPPTGTEFQQFKTSYDTLSPADQKIVLDNLRELLGVKGQRKSEAQVLQMLEDADPEVISTKFSRGMHSKKGAKYKNYNIAMKPYNVYA